MNSERTEKRREFIINTLYIALVALLVILGFRYVARWLTPFIIGFVIAFSVNAPVNAICKKININRKFCAIFMLILEYSLIVLLVWGLGSKIVGSLADLFKHLPRHYDNIILPFLENAQQQITALTSRISPETMNTIYDVLESSLESLRGFIINLSASMGKAIAGMTARLPFFLISFVFSILASIFISTDYQGIVIFIKKQLPPKAALFISDAKRHLGKTVSRYLRAYLIIWVLTFTELSIGLSILKIENSIGIAALIAFADIFPVIGTGTILMPWTIISLITQNYYTALGLIILYIIITLVRNFTEPKIVGDQLGLNPVVTLIAIYLGYIWMGVGGMILLPIITTILVGLHKTGKIKLWKE